MGDLPLDHRQRARRRPAAPPIAAHRIFPISRSATRSATAHCTACVHLPSAARSATARCTAYRGAPNFSDL
jgi:hypothetical protein